MKFGSNVFKELAYTAQTVQALRSKGRCTVNEVRTSFLGRTTIDDHPLLIKWVACKPGRMELLIPFLRAYVFVRVIETVYIYIYMTTYL